MEPRIPITPARSPEPPLYQKRQKFLNRMFADIEKKKAALKVKAKAQSATVQPSNQDLSAPNPVEKA
jgi:hypothetical protein